MKTKETIKIKIFDIVWSGEDSDQVPTEFLVEENVEVFEEYKTDEGDIDISGFVQDWVDYNGSKWGVTPEDFDWNQVSIPYGWDLIERALKAIPKLKIIELTEMQKLLSESWTRESDYPDEDFIEFCLSDDPTFWGQIPPVEELSDEECEEILDRLSDMYDEWNGCELFPFN